MRQGTQPHKNIFELRVRRQQLFCSTSRLAVAIVVCRQQLHLPFCILRDSLHPVNRARSIRSGKRHAWNRFRNCSVPLLVLLAIGIVVKRSRPEWLSFAVVVNFVTDLKRPES